MANSEVAGAVTLPIYPFRTTTYAITIYVNGTNRLVKSVDPPFPGVMEGYYIPVEQYAAKTYTKEQIDLALAKGWITLQQWEETMNYKQPVPPTV